MASDEDRGGVRELGEREFDRSREREKKSPKEETNHKNDEPEETKSVLSGNGSDIPPSPPTIPTETYDTALNLTLEVPSDPEIERTRQILLSQQNLLVTWPNSTQWPGVVTWYSRKLDFQLVCT